MGLFSSIGNLVGGFLGFNQAKSQHNDQMALANAQVQFQQDYAKNRLQWQVEDAKKAGLHPMVAAGLSPTSFSPVSYPTSSPTDYSWVSNIGQNLDYAASKAKTSQQMSQAAQLMHQSQEAVVDGQELDNELKRMEIAAMKARLLNAGPPSPTSNHAPGLIGGQDGSVSVLPDEVVSSDSVNPSATAGTHPLWTHARSGDFVLPVLSDKLADAVTENKEKNVGAELNYFINAWDKKVSRPQSAYTSEERAKLKSGDYVDRYYPLLGWRVEPKVTWKNFKRFIGGDYKKRFHYGGGVADWR